MKGFGGIRKSPGNKKHSDGTSMRMFSPQIDKQAKWHKEFDDQMNDTAHKKKMAKVSLPKITFKELKD